MSAITPVLDTLLPQVHGRRKDVERLAATAYKKPLTAIDRVTPPRASDARPEARAPNARAGPAGQGGKTPAAAIASSGQNAADPTAFEAVESASARLDLSNAGRAIAALLQRSANAAPAEIAGGAALLGPGQPPVPATLASLLAQQVGYSGLFYESHLLHWLQGRRPRRLLQREPQMRLPVFGGAGQGSAGRGAPSPATGGPSPHAILASDTQASTPAPVRRDPVPSPGQGHGDPVDERLLPLLRTQLEVLDAGVFRWQGLAWSGVSMHWEIREHDAPPRQAPEPGTTPRRYTTSLRLELPALGAIEVRLALNGRNIHVHAWAAQGPGGAMLRAKKDSLARRLRAAGFARAAVDCVAGKTA